MPSLWWLLSELIDKFEGINMIAGNINMLKSATLPPSLYHILSRPEMSLNHLQQLTDGHYQPDREKWFYHISHSNTSPAEERHTEFHRQFLDIQLVLQGQEIIHYSLLNVSEQSAFEKKTDLFILSHVTLTNHIYLSMGDFVTFYPGEPHQALCMVDRPDIVRKAVFKVPISLL